MHCKICGIPVDEYDEFCYSCDTEFNIDIDPWDHAMVDDEWEEM